MIWFCFRVTLGILLVCVVEYGMWMSIKRCFNCEVGFVTFFLLLNVSYRFPIQSRMGFGLFSLLFSSDSKQNPLFLVGL